MRKGGDNWKDEKREEKRNKREGERDRRKGRKIVGSGRSRGRHRRQVAVVVVHQVATSPLPLYQEQPPHIKNIVF